MSASGWITKEKKLLNTVDRSLCECKKLCVSGAFCVCAHECRVYIRRLGGLQYLWSPLRAREKSRSPRKVQDLAGVDRVPLPPP